MHCMQQPSWVVTSQVSHQSLGSLWHPHLSFTGNPSPRANNMTFHIRPHSHGVSGLSDVPQTRHRGQGNQAPQHNVHLPNNGSAFATRRD